MVNYRTLKPGDVLLDGFQRLWAVSKIEDDIITLSDPYGTLKDRPIFAAITQKPAFWDLFKFAWNATAEVSL